jgi:hypothetical protein
MEFIVQQDYVQMATVNYRFRQLCRVGPTGSVWEIPFFTSTAYMLYYYPYFQRMSDVYFHSKNLLILTTTLRDSSKPKF